MTTTELKQYIDKVLGNSIRCLLPSYWWKRLFNQVADRIDEVEQSASELIETKVNEVKMPIVESVDELEKLKLAKGRVAAVEKTGESATVKISDCYFSANSKEDWGKYTIVKGVEEKDNVIIDKDTSVLFTASKEMAAKDALQISTISGTFLYSKWIDNEGHITTLEEVNKALSSGKYRAVQCLNAPDDYLTFYSEKPQPGLYIKGDSWTRLLKEGDEIGLEVRELYIIGNDVITGNVSEEYTAEQLAYNKETVDLYKQGKVSLVMNATIKTLNLDISCTPINYININNGTVICYEVNAVIARAMILVTVDNTGNAQLFSDDISSGSLSINELDITSPAQIQGIIAKVRKGEHDIYWVGSETQSSSCLSYHIFDDLQLFAITDDIKMYLFDLTGNRLITDKKNRIYIPASRMATNNAQRVKKNSVIYRLIVNNVISGTDCFLYDHDTYKDHQVMECLVRTVGNSTYVDFTTIIDGNKVTFNLIETGQFEGENATPLITCDTELSDTSENPVQNKVVKAYVDDKLDDLTEEVIANEEVNAAALNDLNVRINELEERLKNAGL